MFLEWWMILMLGVIWIASILSYGSTSFTEGAVAVMSRLQEVGYIRIDEDGEIVGLCNQDQESWRNFHQEDTEEEE
jgi:predicted RNA polymerase sigma factor